MLTNKALQRLWQAGVDAVGGARAVETALAAHRHATP